MSALASCVRHSGRTIDTRSLTNDTSTVASASRSDDPKHPGCLRSIKVVGPKMGPDGRKGRNPVAYVKGVDRFPADAESKSCVGTPDLASVWKLEGKVAEDGETIFIDFSSKVLIDHSYSTSCASHGSVSTHVHEAPKADAL